MLFPFEMTLFGCSWMSVWQRGGVHSRFPEVKSFTEGTVTLKKMAWGAVLHSCKHGRDARLTRITPCTLHPASYTLHPAPCTLHPAP